MATSPTTSTSSDAGSTAPLTGGLPYTPWDPRYPKSSQVPYYFSEKVWSLGSDPYPNLRTLKGYEAAWPWMGTDLLLHFFTPDELNDLGCVNLTPMPPISERFRIDQDAVESAFDLRIDNPRPHGNNTGIHPIFRSINWRYTSPLDYEMLKPSLRIATEMLYMDSVLDFFWTIGQPWTATKGTKMSKKDSPYLYKIFPGKSTLQDRINTAADLLTFKDLVWISWEENLEHGVDAMASADSRSTILRAGGWSSSILINEAWRDFLNWDYMASNYNPAADDESAMMRGRLQLAIVLVHELAHAYKFAVTSNPLRFRISPYVNDQRISELGFALEMAMMGNSNVTLTKNGNNPFFVGAPFGWHSTRFPGNQDFSGIYPLKASAAKVGIQHKTVYGLPMTFVHQFFTDEFWVQKVQRFGAAALAVPRPFGVREHFGLVNFDPLESPRIRTRWSPTRWLHVDDPEQGYSPDGLHPAVREGYLWPDRAQGLDLSELNPKTGKIMGTFEYKVAKAKRKIKQKKAELRDKSTKWTKKVGALFGEDN